MFEVLVFELKISNMMIAGHCFEVIRLWPKVGLYYTDCWITVTKGTHASTQIAELGNMRLCSLHCLFLLCTRDVAWVYLSKLGTEISVEFWL